MKIYTDDWIKNDFMEIHQNINISIDNVIKLKNPLGEAFWIIVTEILPNNKFVGKVNNHLIKNSQYNYDDLVSFTISDICDYKNKEIQEKQLEYVKEIIQRIAQELGRMPTIEEIDLYCTNITHSGTS